MESVDPTSNDVKVVWGMYIRRCGLSAERTLKESVDFESEENLGGKFLVVAKNDDVLLEKPSA